MKSGSAFAGLAGPSEPPLMLSIIYIMCLVTKLAPKRMFLSQFPIIFTLCHYQYIIFYYVI